jgi:hypothetical protein
MTERIGNYLENDTNQSHPMPSLMSKYNQIDSEIELVPCMTCYAKYHASPVFDLTSQTQEDSQVNPDWIASFSLMTGKEPILPLSLYYERIGTVEGDGQLTYIDQSGTYSFPVQLKTLIAERVDSTPLFQGLCGTQFHSFGISYFGELHPLTGANIKIAVNYNMDRRKVSILPLGDRFFPRPIFVSDGSN